MKIYSLPIYTRQNKYIYDSCIYDKETGLIIINSDSINSKSNTNYQTYKYGFDCVKAEDIELIDLSKYKEIN